MYKKTNKSYQENFQITSQVKFCPNAFRVDLYRGCDFGCHYCFSNMEAFKENGTGLKYWREAELESLRHKFELAFESDKEYKEIIIELLRHKVPLHCGGMSDPFQSREWDLHLTHELIKLSNKYQYPITFSTKTSTMPEAYFEILDPKLHAFQISIMGWSDSYIKTWEGNTPTAQERANFVKLLRDKGFWCSVRIQPIIDVEECELLMHNLKDIPSYYSIEHLHILADSTYPRNHYEQNCTHKEDLYFNGGTIEFKPSVKIENVKRLMKVANSYGVRIGAADNDLHYMSQSRCCCGTDTINENFDNYLKFNTCYLSTGESDLSTIWIPQSNCRRHMNVGKGKQVVKIEDIVRKYILDNPDLIPEPYSSKVNKELFGVHHKKLF